MALYFPLPYLSEIQRDLWGEEKTYNTTVSNQKVGGSKRPSPSPSFNQVKSVNGFGCFPQAGYVTFFFPLFLHPGLQLALTHFLSVRKSNGKQYN